MGTSFTETTELLATLVADKVAVWTSSLLASFQNPIIGVPTRRGSLFDRAPRLVCNQLGQSGFSELRSDKDPRKPPFIRVQRETLEKVYVNRRVFRDDTKRKKCEQEEKADDSMLSPVGKKRQQVIRRWSLGGFNQRLIPDHSGRTMSCILSRRNESSQALETVSCKVRPKMKGHQIEAVLCDCSTCLGGAKDGRIELGTNVYIGSRLVAFETLPVQVCVTLLQVLLYARLLIFIKQSVFSGALVLL